MKLLHENFNFLNLIIAVIPFTLVLYDHGGDMYRSFCNLEIDQID